MKSKFFSFMTATVVMCCLISTTARAEYYVDYLPQDTCERCYSQYYQKPHSTCASQVKKHKHHKYAYHKPHKRHSSYSISVTYVGSSAYNVGCCNQVRVSDHCCNHCRPTHCRNRYSYAYPSHECRRTYEAGYDEWLYEPNKDMSTEDDGYYY